jgi:aminoglycoside 6'-N-acetyltransferase I
MAEGSFTARDAALRVVEFPSCEERAVREAAQLLVNGFREHWPEAWPDLETAVGEVREALSPERICRAAVEVEGHVLGWTGGIPLYGGKVWEVHPLVVRPDVQGRGIGRALVADLEERVRERGGGTLWVGTDDEDGMTSLSGADLYPEPVEHLRRLRNLRGHPFGFYLRLGFALAGVVPDAHGPGRPDILLAKRVRRGPA